MNKNDFISLIEQPEKLGEQHVTALKKIATDFPYFQIPQLLLTKALHNESHYEYEKQLKYTAVMLPDRAVLYRFIQKIVEVEPLLENTETINLKAKVSIIVEQENTNTLVEELQIDNTLEPENIDIELTTILENKTQLEETTIIEEIKPKQIEETLTIEVEPKADAVIESKSPRAKENADEKHSFSEWLKIKQQNNGGTQIEIEKPSILIAETVEPPIANPTIQQEIAKQVERSNINEFESVLDKFIRENPRISRGKAEFYNPVNMAKQSVEEDDDLVTETLATVYYKQGNYKKAIRAYEKLCLIYPHKMTYFASLIQKIKTESKD